MINRAKGVVLLSGGLNSALTLKLMLEQGVEILGVRFSSPFCTCDQQGKCYAKEHAEKLGIPIKTINKDDEYLNIIKNPKYGYGAGANPCIDCCIFMLKQSWIIAEKCNAQFLVTGEIIGQYSIPQYKQAIMIIEKESGLQGKIVRPLSTQYLPETEAEQRGWINREQLLNIQGKNRKKQIELAVKNTFEDYICSSGGCLLTDKQFSKKIFDLFKNKTDVSWKDIEQLKSERPA